MRKSKKLWLNAVFISFILTLSACTDSFSADFSSQAQMQENLLQEAGAQGSSFDTGKHSSIDPENIPANRQENESEYAEDDTSFAGGQLTASQASYAPFSLSDVPLYSGQPYAAVNDNIPYFSESDLTEQSFETYSDLDAAGRCGVAYACIGTDIMPTEERDRIGNVRPTGWHTIKYSDVIEDNYLYNRCHLIGYQLSGENANEKNLITGTRYLNVQGMLPFENLVADYVTETGNHVLYRVTPIFEGDNLLASGVLMEAESVEDHGESILFCVFVYNVQPGILIDYATGESSIDPNAQQQEIFASTGISASESVPEPTEAPTSGSAPTSGQMPAQAEPSVSESAAEPAEPQAPAPQEPSVSQEEPQEITYILNTSTKKFHYPYCKSVKQMNDKNKKEYTGSRDEVISQGFVPCKNCDP